MERERMERRAPLTPELNEKFLQRLKETRQSLGIRDSKMEVRFDGLSVEANGQVGLRTPPTLINVTLNAIQELKTSHCPSSTCSNKILNRLTGVIRPSRMTLVLGPPGSGKSTFLRALSGKLDPAFKIGGKVTFNGQELKPFSSEQLRMYVSQQDLHHTEMTVRDTLDFSSQIFGTDKAFEALSGVTGSERASTNKLAPEIDELLEATSYGAGSNLTTNYILKLLGLEDCTNVIVGDEMRRGISGGQKKRVTIGEMLISLARSFFMDDISTGLDSSTTYMIVKFLGQIAHIMDTTMVISLIQPSPETFELFDDVILLCQGLIVYQGHRENVLEFFEFMGFKCPDRKNIADFLQEVISKMDQEQYWKDNQREYQYLPVEKFAESFSCYYLDQHLEDKQHIKGGNDKSERTIASGENYRMSNWKLFKACFSREVLLLKRNSPVHIFKSIQIMILALVTMTLFFRTNMDHHSIAGGNKFVGAIFTGLVTVMFNGMTELAMIVKRLPVFYKQRELLLLPGWALVFSILILSIPMTLIETGIWISLTYFVIGYAPSATRFFRQYLVFISAHQMSMGLFRLIAAIGKTQMMANTLGTTALIAIYILAGFVISRDNIQPWLKWGYWSSPLTYGQNALALNEFLDERWSEKMYGNNNESIGEVILRTRGMLTQWHWYWISIGALVGFSLIFNILTIFALEYANNPYKHKVTASTEAKDPQLNRKDDEQKEGRASTPLPFQPLILVFHHISYYVDTPKEMKTDVGNGKRLQLLRDVSGAFRPGILTALMGITGAGKTTLLDVLAGRKTGGYIEGNISISGYPKRQDAFARISGYCEQTDVHSPFLTVHESLHFSAWLRLPPHVEQQDRNMFVEEVMSLVELQPLKRAIVGLPGAHGLSAEQRKRLTIAVELVASPSIIFLDEPTTGLDARAAAIVMRTVRKTVDTGRTVVCTIHQPSIEIFEAFDELLLMKSGGQLIYSGTLGPLSQTMINYFEAIPGVPKIRKGQNPSTWMLDITSTIIEYNLQIDYASIYRNSSLYRENMEMVEELSKRRPNLEELQFLTTHSLSFKMQCLACLWKQNRSYWKNPEHNIVRFITTVVTSLLFGAVFWQIGSNTTTEQDIFNILGIMYGSALFLGFANASIVQPVVGTERTVLYRERAAGMYSSLPSVIAQVAIEIPYILVQVLIFSSTVYPMAGFELVITKFLWFVIFMLLSFFYFTLFGMMVVALTPIQDVAALLAFLIFIVWNLFSGFLVAKKMIPIWWRWFYWASPAAWTIYGLLFSQLGDQVELIKIPGGTDQTIKEFLEVYLGVESTYFPVIVALHLGIIVFFFIVFFVGIKHLNFQRK